jgi:hypothetical protein
MNDNQKATLIVVVLFVITAVVIYCGCNVAINKVLGI